MGNKVEFVSYTGRYPCLCSGELILRIDGELVSLGNCLSSGGNAWIDDTGEEQIETGAWGVDVPAEYKHLEKEITAVVNQNVEFGCCGGCI